MVDLWSRRPALGWGDNWWQRRRSVDTTLGDGAAGTTPGRTFFAAGDDGDLNRSGGTVAPATPTPKTTPATPTWGGATSGATLAAGRTKTGGYDTARGGQFGRPGSYDDAGWDIRGGRLWFRNGTRMTESPQGRVLRLAMNKMQGGADERTAYDQATAQVIGEINAIGAADSTFSLYGYVPGMVQYAFKTDEPGGWQNPWDWRDGRDDALLIQLRNILNADERGPGKGLVAAGQWAPGYAQQGAATAGGGNTGGGVPPTQGGGAQMPFGSGAAAGATAAGDASRQTSGGVPPTGGQYPALMAGMLRDDPNRAYRYMMQAKGFDPDVSGPFAKYLYQRLGQAGAAMLNALNTAGGLTEDQFGGQLMKLLGAAYGGGGAADGGGGYLTMLHDAAAQGLGALSKVPNAGDDPDAVDRFVQQMLGLTSIGLSPLGESGLESGYRRFLNARDDYQFQQGRPDVPGGFAQYFLDSPFYKKWYGR